VAAAERLLPPPPAPSYLSHRADPQRSIDESERSSIERDQSSSSPRAEPAIPGLSRSGPASGGSRWPSILYSGLRGGLLSRPCRVREYPSRLYTEYIYIIQYMPMSSRDVGVRACRSSTCHVRVRSEPYFYDVYREIYDFAYEADHLAARDAGFAGVIR